MGDYKGHKGNSKAKVPIEMLNLYLKQNLTQHEIGTYILEILKEGPMSPKNVREMFHHEHYAKVRNAIAVMCDSGKLRLDSDMLLHVSGTK